MISWRRVTNIWLKKIVRKDKFDFSDWRPLLLDYSRLARQCRIRLYHQFNSAEHVTECTVAEAVSQYIRPGQCMLPREPPVTSVHTVKRVTAQLLKRLGRESYRAGISDYVLVNLDAAHVLGKRKRGPQVLLFDILGSQKTHEIIMSHAYAALKAGKTTTFALATRHILEVEETPVKTDNHPMEPSGHHATLVSPVGVEAQLATLEQPATAKTQEDNDRLQSRVQQQAEQIDDDIQELEAQASLILAELQQYEDDPLGVVAAEEERRNEDYLVNMAKPRRLQGQNSERRNNENMSRWSKSSESDLTSKELPQSSSIIDLAGSDPSSDGPNAYESESNITGAGVSTMDEERDMKSTPSIPNPDDPPLRLVKITAEQCLQPSHGALRMLEWAAINMPHLWPNVVQACMPPGSEVALYSYSDGTQIQFVIKPRRDAAVRGILHDAEPRGIENWL